MREELIDKKAKQREDTSSSWVTRLLWHICEETLKGKDSPPRTILKNPCVLWGNVIGLHFHFSGTLPHIYLIKRTPPAVSPPHLNRVRFIGLFPAPHFQHTSVNTAASGTFTYPLAASKYDSVRFKNAWFSTRNNLSFWVLCSREVHIFAIEYMHNSRPCMLLTGQWENQSFNTGKTVMSCEICLQPWAHSPRNRMKGLTDKYQGCLFISSTCPGAWFCQVSVDTKQSLLYLLDGNERNTVNENMSACVWAHLTDL